MNAERLHPFSTAACNVFKTMAFTGAQTGPFAVKVCFGRQLPRRRGCFARAEARAPPPGGAKA